MLVVGSNQNDYFGTSDQYVGQVLGPHIKSGQIAAKNLENFHHVAAWHYREEGIIDPVIQTGYPDHFNCGCRICTRNTEDR